MINLKNIQKSVISVVLLSGLTALFFLISLNDYVFFHTGAEFFTILIAGAIFILAWNTKKFLQSHYLLFLGISFFFTALIDFFHIITYKGTNILVLDPTSNLPTQLWLASRYLQVVSFITAPLFLKRKFNQWLMFSLFSAVAILLLLSIFYWRIFPTAFIEGRGLTPFKIVSEYLIFFGFILSGFILWRYRDHIEKSQLKLFLIAITCSAASEIAFTFYVSAYGFSNFVGHILRIIAYYFIYRSAVTTILERPYETMFKNIKDSRDTLALQAEKLNALAIDLKKYKTAVEYGSDMIVLTDPNGKIIFANKATEALTGFNQNEIIGKKPGELWGGATDKEFYENLLGNMGPHNSFFRGEFVNRRKNGEEFLAETHISPILDANNKIVFFFEIHRDITEAKEVDRAKSEFISMAAHELRTPLAAVSLTTEMLLRGVIGKNGREMKKYLKELFGEIQHMTSIITTFLTISRIELGTLKIDPRPTDLIETIDSAITHQLEHAEGKKISVKKIYPSKLPLMEIDQGVISTIVQNLLSNSVKYTPEQGKITIKVYKNKKNIILSISDNGYGIPKKDVSKIFQKMYRASNVLDKKIEGIGLGLYVVKSLAEQSECKIWFESKENKGTVFFLAVPLSGMKS